MLGRAKRTVMVTLVAAWLSVAGCGENSDPGSSGIRPDPAVDELVERCAWGRDGDRPVPAREIRDAFVRADDEPLSLLVSGTEFRPGERIDFALDNRAAMPAFYGLDRGLRDAGTGAQAPDGVTDIPGIGLEVRPGQVGECMSIEIANSMPPGRYIAYIASVDLGDDERDVEAEFTVAGEPLAEAERVPAGVIEPVTAPVEVLWHPDGDAGSPGGTEDSIECDRKVDRRRSMFPLVDAVEAALPGRSVEWWIDRSTCPPTFPVVVPNAGPAGLAAFLEVVGGERAAIRSRVALTTVPFTRKEFEAEVRKLEGILEEEGHEHLGFAHSGTQGDATLDIDFAELEVVVKERLDAEVEIPIRYYVQSGP